jgi:putative hydrolase of the HAD superfamily
VTSASARSASHIGPRTVQEAAANGATGVRAVCLDVDDTLVDHSASARGALRLLLGHDNAWPLWQQVTDEHVLRVVAGIVDSDTMRWQRTKEFFCCLGELLDDSEAMRREDVRVRAMRARWALYDDVLPCLEWLVAVGVKIAVVTNASGPYQRAKLANLGVAAFIDEVVIAGELGAAKPDPVIFHTACDRLGCRPAEVAHVGDRLDLDAIGARDAGLAGVWLNRTGPAGGVLPADVSMITSLDLLPELLVCDLDLVPR